MKSYYAIVLTALFPLMAKANCIPPYQIQFACEVTSNNARAEFCRIPDPKKHPGLKEAYYTYANKSGRTELHFETDSTWFSTKDTNINHPTDLTMAIGYARGTYVYAFVVTEDKRAPDGIRDAEVRVYKSVDAFTSETKDTEATRLYCKSSTILADRDSIRP